MGLASLGVFLLILGTIWSYRSEEPGMQESEVILEFSHGVSNPDPEFGVIKCVDGVASFEYTFTNGAAHSNFGLMLFLDGILQPYCLELGKPEQVIYPIELSPNEERTAEIFFTPATTLTENSDLYITAIYDVLHRPEDPDANPLFLHHLSQSLPFSIDYDGSVYQKQAYAAESSSHVAKVSVVEEDSISEEESASDLQLYAISSEEDDSQELVLQLICKNGIDTDYRVYLFECHEPVMWDDGQLYYDIHATDGTISTITCTIDSVSPELFYYAVAVPIDISNRWSAPLVLKSRTGVFPD